MPAGFVSPSRGTLKQPTGNTFHLDLRTILMEMGPPETLASQSYKHSNLSYLMCGQHILSIPSKHLYPVLDSNSHSFLRSLTSTTVTRVRLLYTRGGNIGTEVELGVTWEGWELDGAQRHLKGLSLRHLPPTHIYKIWTALLSHSKGVL
jgi:hypothetical protein